MTHNIGDPGSITPEMAAQIRAWRVDGDYTYRAVAQAATDLWGSDWGSNQIYGAALCAAAAKMLGEDLNQEPWN